MARKKSDANEAAAEQYKVVLLVVDDAGDLIEGDDLALFVAEEAVLQKRGTLKQSQKEARTKRGNVFCYRSTCEQIMGVPTDPKGALYAEMMKVKPVLKKLKKAQPGTHLLLDAEDFNTLKTRIAEYGYPQINETVWDFIDNIEDSVVVQVQEKKERKASPPGKAESKDSK